MTYSEFETQFIEKANYYVDNVFIDYNIRKIEMDGENYSALNKKDTDYTSCLDKSIKNFYNDFLNDNKSIDRFTYNILLASLSNSMFLSKVYSIMSDKKQLLDHLIVITVKSEKNEIPLTNMIYKTVTDVIAYCAIFIDDLGVGVAVLPKDKALKTLKMSEEDIFDIAVKNTTKRFEPEINTPASAEPLLHFKELKWNIPMVAGTILFDTTILKEISKDLGDCLLIVPIDDKVILVGSKDEISDLDDFYTSYLATKLIFEDKDTSFQINFLFMM